MQGGVMQAKHKFLTFDQQVECWQRWRAGDERAGETLYNSHELFIMKHARYFASRHRGADLDDITSAAKRGFFQALERFNPEHRCIIATYAGPWIRESIKHEISNITYAPKMNHSGLVAVRAIAAEIKADKSGDSPMSEIFNRVAVKLNREPEEIRYAYEKAGRRVVSLDEPVNGEADTSATLAEITPDENLPQPLDGLAEEKMASLVRKAVDQLEPRLKTIISMRFGIASGSDDGATLEELGQELKISKERVRQLQTKAFAQLRNALAQAGIDRDFLTLDA